MSNTVQGALWMIGAIFSFSTMAVAGRALSTNLDTFEIMLYRSLIGLMVVVLGGYFLGTLGQISRRHMGLQFARNVSHFFGQNLWFYAITVLPLAQVFALEFTSPLWVVVLSPIFLGERLTPMRLVASIFGFIGILIVARPSASTLDWGILSAALAAVGFALTIVFTRRLTRTETATCILFYLTLMQAVFGLICAGLDGDIAVPPLQAMPWIGIIAFCGLLAHFCLTKALSVAPAPVVIPIDFARLPLIAVVGMLFYAEPLDIWVLVGAAVIFAANYANIVHETRR